MLIQCNVDRGQGIHGPTGVLVTGGKHFPHELLHEIRKAAVDNTLPRRKHQGELHKEAQRDSFSRQHNQLITISMHKKSWKEINKNLLTGPRE